MHGGYANFYSRPCGRGDEADVCGRNAVIISTHAPAGGATYKVSTRVLTVRCISTHAPAGGATNFSDGTMDGASVISTHAPAGGATCSSQISKPTSPVFLLTPLREGRLSWLSSHSMGFCNFYSRPCGRGDSTASAAT